MAQTVLAPIDTQERAGIEINLPIEAAIHMYPGVIAAKNPAGNAIYATDTAGLEVVGRCQADMDNSAGAAGAMSVNLKRGVFKWVNSAANPLAAANVGQLCFVQDEQTVTTAAGSVNLVKAGVFLGLDPDDGKAWVDTRPSSFVVPSADTLTGLVFASPPTQANLQALQAALIVILKAQGLII